MIIVVGIGADGMAGLAPTSRDELRRAAVIFGSRRQLDLLDDSVRADRREWPSPMLPALHTLLDGVEGDVHVVASGDPLLHGIGSTLIRLYGRRPGRRAATCVVGDVGVLASSGGRCRTPRSSASSPPNRTPRCGGAARPS